MQTAEHAQKKWLGCLLQNVSTYLPKNKHNFSVSYRKLWKWFLYMCIDIYLMRASGVGRSKCSLSTCLFSGHSNPSTGWEVKSEKSKQTNLKKCKKTQCLYVAEFTLFHVATWLEKRNLPDES